MRWLRRAEQKVAATHPLSPARFHRPLRTHRYRGGKICLDAHFRPLWARNVPHFGIAHAMALGMGPWLAVEIPSLIANGKIKHQEGAKSSE